MKTAYNVEKQLVLIKLKITIITMFTTMAAFNVYIYTYRHWCSVKSFLKHLKLKIYTRHRYIIHMYCTTHIWVCYLWIYTWYFGPCNLIPVLLHTPLHKYNIKFHLTSSWVNYIQKVGFHSSMYICRWVVNCQSLLVRKLELLIMPLRIPRTSCKCLKVFKVKRSSFAINEIYLSLSLVSQSLRYIESHREL